MKREHKPRLRYLSSGYIFIVELNCQEENIHFYIVVQIYALDHNQAVLNNKPF